MWIAKCCTDQPNLNKKFRSTVKLYYKGLLTKVESEIQKNSYSNTQILIKRCHIKDRSLAAQDTAVNNNIRDLENTKELIFQYFDITSLQFNEVEWSGGRYKVLGTSKQSRVTMDGTAYTATDNAPFVSILIALKKL